ncbi:hypothetical protein F0L74_03095 [Chitinophaga agrisoli]|uniref:Aspartyl protease n=1 Tax=Chitinophaga agrisoli TaxID=2607653 RepID=A0A5B2VYN3_9BACT|nr:aspartyl protease family protein [Chitinophaga agrisoli]KAA2244963.1 hypothetical protein F0L74_03095 [Chitinophaga agrisoli]
MRIHVLFILLFCHLSLLTVAQFKKRKAAEPVMEQGPAAVIPFQLYGHQVVIPVTTSGNSDTLHFIFDSGTEVTVLHYGLAQKLQVQNKQLSGVSANNDLMLAVNTAVLNVLYLGKTRLPFVKVFLENIPEFRKGPLVIDGFIGIDLLKEFIVKIDYTKQQLVLYKHSAPPELPAGTEQIPFRINFNTPVIPATIQLPGGASLTSNYHLVSGGDYGVLFNWPYVEKNKLNEQLVTESTDQVQELIKIDVYTNSTIPSLTLGTRQLSKIPVSYCEDVNDDSPLIEIAGAIGYEVWKQFSAVTINYRQKLLYLQR